MTGVMDAQQLPWAVSLAEFAAAARGLGTDGACSVFVVDAMIPATARPGYAALVMAYVRATEPVTVSRDGVAALLITSGGLHAATTASRRIIDEAGKLGLADTLRAGIALLDGDAVRAIGRAREAATTGAAGGVAGRRGGRGCGGRGDRHRDCAKRTHQCGDWIVWHVGGASRWVRR